MKVIIGVDPHKATHQRSRSTTAKLRSIGSR